MKNSLDGFQVPIHISKAGVALDIQMAPILAQENAFPARRFVRLRTFKPISPSFMVFWMKHVEERQPRDLGLGIFQLVAPGGIHIKQRTSASGPGKPGTM